MTTEAKLFRIKPLESTKWAWAETRIRRGYICSPEHFSFYAFVFQSGRDGEWSDQWCLDVFAGGENSLDAKHCAAPEEGKQLAEANWNEYIKQALIEVEQV